MSECVRLATTILSASAGCESRKFCYVREMCETSKNLCVGYTFSGWIILSSMMMMTLHQKSFSSLIETSTSNEYKTFHIS